MTKRIIRVISFAIIVFAVGGMTSCRKTPSKDNIVNKNDSSLSEMIDDTEDGTDIETKDGSHREEWVNEAGDVTVTVSIDYSEGNEQMPVIRAASREISMDEIRKWADVLFEGKTVYEPQTRESKSEILERIAEIKGLMDEDELLEIYGTKEAVAGMMKYYQEMLDEYEAKYSDAPDNIEEKETDWAFHTEAYYNDIYSGEDSDGIQYFECMAHNVNGHTATISVMNRDRDDFKINMLFFYYQNSEELLVDHPLKVLPEEEVKRIADETIEELGLEKEWVIYDINTNEFSDRCISMVRYVPCYNGINLIPVRLMFISGDAYARKMYYSELTVTITNGLVEGIELQTPLEQKEVINDNVKIIHFEEAYRIFKEQAFLQFTKESLLDKEDPGYSQQHAYVCVNKVQKGLFRIKEKDKEDSYLLVPAWLFCGWRDYGYGDSTPSADMHGESTPVMIINAIDGSIIDPNQGY